MDAAASPASPGDAAASTQGQLAKHPPTAAGSNASLAEIGEKRSERVPGGGAPPRWVQSCV